jgi:hypothetical protein
MDRADAIVRLPVRDALAHLELPVLADAHAEPPRGLSHQPAGPLPIVLEPNTERVLTDPWAAVGQSAFVNPRGQAPVRRLHARLELSSWTA